MVAGGGGAVPDSELFVGAVGWDHDAWAGTFFPDDLPADWRLTYYANEYPLVLVPAALWQGASPEQAAAWADDVADAFRFFLDAPPGPWRADGAGPRLRACANALGERFAGVLADEPPPGDPVERLFLPRREPRVPGRLYVSRGAAPRRTCDRVLVWEGGRLPDLPERRGALEALVQGCARGRDAALFIAGSPPSIDGLEETLTLARLMGLS